MTSGSAVLRDPDDGNEDSSEPALAQRSEGWSAEAQVRPLAVRRAPE